MKITAYDPEHSWRLATGVTLGTTAGGDLSGTVTAPKVVGIQGTSVTSNLPTTVGDVLTVLQVTPPIAGWATPSNMGGTDTSLVTVAATGATETVDVSAARTYDLTLDDDCTLTLSGATTAEAWYVTLLLRQDGTGGRTVTWPGSVEWPGGVTPTLSTAANAVDVFTLFTLDGGTLWFGFPTGGGDGGTPATTVESETTFGLSAAVGTDTEYARQDHTHGTPSLAGSGAVGELLISDTPAGSPLVFADILQNEAGTDLIYADLGA